MGRTSAEWDKNKVYIDAEKAANNSVYAREIWNAAIEKAASMVEINSAADIRKLKK